LKKNLIPLTLGGLGIGTTEFVMMGMLPDIAKDFQVSIPVAGHLISAYALGVVIGAPLLVAISSNYPPKKTLTALMIMFTVFNAFSAFAPDHNALFIARLLSGLPHGAFFGVGSVVASRLAEKGKQAQAISIMFAGLTYIGHHYSWRFTFGLIAFIGLTALLFIQLWLPALPVSREGDIKSEMSFFKTPEAWLVLLITAIGTGGLFCWISYIAPLMTDIGHFSKNTVPLILVIAGLGMVIGNILGGKLADWVAPVKACLILLVSMALALITIYFVSGNQVLSLIMTFITGSLSMAIGSPIQILMIRTAKGAEMLGAAATQAAFNTGNALGAFLGGLPIVMGYGFASPELVGVLMAVTGAAFAVVLLKRQNAQRTLKEVVNNYAGHD
jgi:DHA1 family arabinose polymer transporter-like MFS transporter